MKLLIISIVCIITLLSCKKDETKPPNENNILIGYWYNTGYEDSVSIMTRSDKLQENNYGFSFFSEDKFIERKNIGFCGTPPIIYADYQGIWKMVSAHLIDITVESWNGEISYRLEIISIDNTTLKCVYRY